MLLLGLILLTPLFFFPLRDGFGIAKVAYMAVLAVAAAYRLWKMDGVRIPYLWALLAFLAGLVLGMKNVINWYDYLLQVGMDIAGVTFLLYGANVRVSGQRVARVISGVALAFSGFSFVLLILRFNGIALYVGRPEWTWESTMGNTGFAAGMIAAMFPVVAWLAWTEKKVWLWLTLALMVLHLDATTSKTPVISLILAGFLALGWTFFRAPRLMAFRATLAACLLFLVIWGAAQNMFSIEVMRPEAIRVRELYWTGTIEIVKDFPFVGVGRGNLQSYFAPYGAEAGDDGSFFVDNAHNDYLQVLAEMGPIGLAGFVGILALSLMRLREPGWKFAFSIAIYTIAVNALTFFPLQTAGMAAYFWVYAGMLGREA